MSDNEDKKVVVIDASEFDIAKRCDVVVNKNGVGYRCLDQKGHAGKHSPSREPWALVLKGLKSRRQQ